MKIGYTMVFLTKTDFPFEIVEFIKNIIPSVVDLAVFGGSYFAAQFMMKKFGGFKGLVVCAGIAVVNLGFFAFRNRHKLLQLKASFAKTKQN